MFAQTYLSQCSGCNPYESFLILAVILSNATSTRRPSLLITCMFSIMLCYGHQSYEDCCWDDTFVKREEETEKGRREIFAFFSFSSSSVLQFFFFSRRQKHVARRLSDFFNKHNSLSPFPRERALDNIIDNNNNSNGRSVL